MGVEHGFVKKAGAWFTYSEGQLGQGRENARRFLKENPDVADGLEKLIKEKLGIGPKVDEPADAQPRRCRRRSPPPTARPRPRRRRPSRPRPRAARKTAAAAAGAEE